MPRLFRSAARAASRFAAWFDRQWGWFFTNGMKQPRPDRLDAGRA